MADSRGDKEAQEAGLLLVTHQPQPRRRQTLRAGYDGERRQDKTARVKSTRGSRREKNFADP